MDRLWRRDSRMDFVRQILKGEVEWIGDGWTDGMDGLVDGVMDRRMGGWMD